jgi:hypothetical protein
MLIPFVVNLVLFALFLRSRAERVLLWKQEVVLVTSLLLVKITHGRNILGNNLFIKLMISLLSHGYEFKAMTVQKLNFNLYYVFVCLLNKRVVLLNDAA